MADGTEIVWTDATWNIVLGCDKVSPGCDRCYAIRTAHRMSANPNPKVSGPYEGTEADGDWTGRVNMVEDRLGWPLRWRRPRRIFVNAQSDLFHKDVTDEFIARVFAVMGLASQHTFQILSKRPGRMRSLLGSRTFHMRVLDQAHLLVHGEVDGVKVPRATGDAYRAAERQAIMRGLAPLPYPLPNVHLGVSVEDQKRAELRIPLLLDTPASVRFLSMEPLLAPVSLAAALAKWSPPVDHPAWDGERLRAASVLHWIIAGGESGKGARPMYPEWVRSIRDQCVEAGVPFLFKQHGEWREVGSDDPPQQSADVWVTPSGRVFPSEVFTFATVPDDVALMRRVGKRKAGRVLDGRTWDEYPEAVTV